MKRDKEEKKNDDNDGVMKESQGQFESGETSEKPRENQEDLKKGKSSENSSKEGKKDDDSCCK